MQLYGSGFSSVSQCARVLYREEGLRAFFVSYPTTLTMTVPFTAIQFATYEWAKKVLNPAETYSPVVHAISGGFAGATAAAFTNPLDVAKTLLQTRGCSNDTDIRNATRMSEAFRLIYHKEGWRGFWRGITPRIFTHMPSNALCWLVRIMLTSRTKASATCSTSKSSLDIQHHVFMYVATASCGQRTGTLHAIRCATGAQG